MRLLVMNPDHFTNVSVIGRIRARGRGVAAWWLVIYPDNVTYSSVRGRICVRGGGGVAVAVTNMKKKGTEL